LSGLRRAPRTKRLEIVFGRPSAAGQSHPRPPRFTTDTMPPMARRLPFDPADVRRQQLLDLLS
jgi:hypothetical protein